MVSGEGRWRTGLGPEWWKFLFFLFQKCLFFGVVAILFSKLFAFYNFCLLVGTVEKKEADLSMNLALTGAREKVVDYSVAYIGW